MQPQSTRRARFPLLAGPLSGVALFSGVVLFSGTLLAALVLCLPAGSAWSEEEAAKPTQPDFEALMGSGGIGKPMPGHRWRPGHAQLLEWGRGEGRTILRAVDPETRQAETLYDVAKVRQLVPGAPGAGVGRIGRAGAPSIVWRPDGKAACLVAKRELAWVDIEKDTMRRLTFTARDVADQNEVAPPAGPMRDIRVSPTGGHVAWSHGRELWVVSTEQGTPRPLTQGSSETLLNATLDWVYPEEFGYRSAIWWAPNGTHIAWLQMDQSRVPRHRLPNLLGLRGEGRQMFYPRAGDSNPTVRVGVTPVEGGDPVWLDAGAYEYIVRVAWTPDASRVLLLTLDRNQQHLRVVSCDPLGKAATKTLFEMKTEGWFDAPSAPQFHDARHWTLRVPRPDGDRWMLLENDATHQRVVAKRLITPAGMDAGRLLRVDLAGRQTWFSGARHQDRHAAVWQAQWGEAPEAELTWGVPAFAKDWLAKHGQASTSLSLDPTARYAVLRSSRTQDPGHGAMLRVADGKVLRDYGSLRGPRWGRWPLPEIEWGELPVEGLTGRIRYRLYKPIHLDPARKYPVIVDVYGGPGARKTSDRWRWSGLRTYLCMRGYAVVEVDGRGSAGQGPDFRFAVRGKLGVLEIADQARVVRHLASKHAWIDGERAGIWGWSYGGTMALNGMTMHPDVFKTGVAVAPVSDWMLYDTIYTERYMGTPQDNAKGYRESASGQHVRKLRGPLLIMHGLADDNVHAQNAYRFMEAAILAGKQRWVELHAFAARGHGIGRMGREVFRRLVTWCERHLEPDRVVPVAKAAEAK